MPISKTTKPSPNPPKPSSNEKSARLRWCCRRGMLELDMILLPFFEAVYPTLGSEQQAQFEQLLTCEDQDLFSWLLGYTACKNKNLANIVKVIHEHAQSPIHDTSQTQE